MDAVGIAARYSIKVAPLRFVQFELLVLLSFELEQRKAPADLDHRVYARDPFLGLGHAEPLWVPIEWHDGRGQRGTESDFEALFSIPHLLSPGEDDRSSNGLI